MGICRCKENKPCSIHFFRKDANPIQYEIKKKEFTETGKVKTSVKSKSIAKKHAEIQAEHVIKEVEKEDKLKKLDPCDCSNCDCDDHGDCDCEDCECIVCDC